MKNQIKNIALRLFISLGLIVIGIVCLKMPHAKLIFVMLKILESSICFGFAVVIMVSAMIDVSEIKKRKMTKEEE